MLFSQTVGIANNHPECSFASPHSNVSCEALVRGGGRGRREGEVGIVGAVVWALALQ